jgi:hypothetical protein
MDADVVDNGRDDAQPNLNTALSKLGFLAITEITERVTSQLADRIDQPL